MTTLRWRDHAGSGIWAHAGRWRYGRAAFRDADTRADAGRGNATSAAACAVHGHDFVEVFWVVEGIGTQEINGKHQVVEAGMLWLIRPLDRHGFRPARGQTLALANVAVPADLVRDLQRRYFPREPDLWGGGGAMPTRYRMGPAERARLARGLDELARSRRDRFGAERFLFNLLHALRIDADPRSASSKNLPMPDWLRRAHGKIQEPEHFAGGTTAFAKLAGRSPEHVARVCRRVLGKTPSTTTPDSPKASGKSCR